MPLLIDTGWVVKENVWFWHIENFGYQMGFDIIDYALSEYDMVKRKDVAVKKNWDYYY